jgi:carboxyl-terminal processing protease
MTSVRFKHLIIASVVGLGSLLLVSAASPGSFFEVTKQLDIFTTLYRELNTYYVDTLNASQLIQSGMRSMTESLDPYTDFIPEDDIQEYRQQTTGRYGGIGALISTRGEFVIITDPYEDCPAAKAGLRPGDKLMEIDGKSVRKDNSDNVSKLLRGKAGTSVVVKILRPQADGTEKEMPITLTREEIKIKNVPYYGVLKNDIGYIRLGSFTERAGLEVRNAMISLITKNKVKGLVLDLRGNPGGLLNEAINVANCFVDRGVEIVNTKGKIKEQMNSYLTQQDPVDTKLPMVVLVDEGSASAAEIVSGSLQDLDRAIVIGEKTYGKGLVQSTHSLPYNAKLKITTAKYYIPSGRCIQAINYADKKEDGSVQKMADSLKVAFKTKGGRTVYDGVGIEPDISIENEKLSQVAIALYIQNIFFDYAVKYRAQTPSITAAKNFALTDAEYNSFVKYVTDKKDFKYSTQSEKLLKDLQTTSEKELLYTAIKQDIDIMQKKLEHDKTNDLIKEKKTIKDLLEQEICSHYYLGAGRIESTIQTDPDVEKAIEILSDSQKTQSILQAKK